MNDQYQRLIEQLEDADLAHSYALRDKAAAIIAELASDCAAAERGHDAAHEACVEYEARIAALTEELAVVRKNYATLTQDFNEARAQGLTDFGIISTQNSIIAALEAQIHRHQNAFENITVADTLKDAQDMAHTEIAFDVATREEKGAP